MICQTCKIHHNLRSKMDHAPDIYRMTCYTFKDFKCSRYTIGRWKYLNLKHYTIFTSWSLILFSFQIKSSQTRPWAWRGIYFSRYFMYGWDTYVLETKFWHWHHIQGKTFGHHNIITKIFTFWRFRDTCTTHMGNSYNLVFIVWENLKRIFRLFTINKKNYFEKHIREFLETKEYTQGSM